MVVHTGREAVQNEKEYFVAYYQQHSSSNPESVTVSQKMIVPINQGLKKMLVRHLSVLRPSLLSVWLMFLSIVLPRAGGNTWEFCQTLFCQSLTEDLLRQGPAKPHAVQSSTADVQPVLLPFRWQTWKIG
jgi:hypothetical protein